VVTAIFNDDDDDNNNNNNNNKTTENSHIEHCTRNSESTKVKGTIYSTLNLTI